MQSIIAFIQAHEVMLAVVLVDILNFAFALSPKFQANSILHWIYQQLAALALKPKP